MDVIGRYYDPTTGQFLSVDPLVDQTGQPYSYAGDDPVENSDPTEAGLWVPGGEMYNGMGMSPCEAWALWDYEEANPGPTGWAYWSPLIQIFTLPFFSRKGDLGAGRRSEPW